MSAKAWTIYQEAVAQARVPRAPRINGTILFRVRAP